MGTIGKRLRSRRKALRLSLDALAARSGLSKSYLCDLERGRQDNPGVNTLVALSDALGLSVEEIVRGVPYRGSADAAAEAGRLAARLAAVELRLRQALAAITGEET